MEFTDQDKLLIGDLINIAWASGAVKNPQMGAMVEQLRAKLQKPKEQPKQEQKK
jgi:hypothetical protein